MTIVAADDQRERDAPETEPVKLSPPQEAPPPAETDVVGEVARVGRYELVPIASLNIDNEYQRDLNQALVQRIAANFDPEVAGAVTLSRRENGALYIVNGAHRVAGAFRAGETHIFAQIIEGADTQTEAKKRLKGNVARADTSTERFKGQVAAGDPESLAILEIARNFDTKVNYLSPDPKDGISAIAALEMLYRRNKGILLTSVLTMIQDAFGHVGGPTATVAMLKGIAWLLERHASEMDRGRMIEKLQVAGPKIIERQARSIGMTHGSALWTNYYRAFIDLYNDRLPEKSKLEWRTGGSKTMGGRGGPES